LKCFPSNTLTPKPLQFGIVSVFCIDISVSQSRLNIMYRDLNILVMY